MSPDRLSKKAKALLLEEANELVYSVASLWEVAIKRGLDRADFQVDPRALRQGLLNNGYDELPVLGQHALATDALPLLNS
jgi:PIN domain nuclease of toxin-antitoxin system